MFEHSDQQTLRTAVGAALTSASGPSYVEAALSRGSDLTLASISGQQIRIRSGDNGPLAALVENGEVVDAHPTGKFVFRNGKCLILEGGRVTRGDDFSTSRRWALFALLPDQ
jgi:hypothetical protein